MTDRDKLPQYNEAQDENDRTPPRKGSKWRKKAGTDEAYDPTPPPDAAPDSQIQNDGRGGDEKVANQNGYETTPPPDKAPDLTDYIEHKRDVDDEDDDEPALNYEIDFGTDDDQVTSNAPNLSEREPRTRQDEVEDDEA